MNTFLRLCVCACVCARVRVLAIGRRRIAGAELARLRSALPYPHWPDHSQGIRCLPAPLLCRQQIRDVHACRAVRKHPLAGPCSVSWQKAFE